MCQKGTKSVEFKIVQNLRKQNILLITLFLLAFFLNYIFQGVQQVEDYRRQRHQVSHDVQEICMEGMEENTFILL